MTSVFTNYLSPYYEEGLLPEVDQSDVAQIFEQMRIAYNQGAPGILDTTRMIASFTNDEDDYDIVHAIWGSQELRQWLYWVNTKITLQLGLQNYITLGVRLRIATSMLNNLVKSDVVSIPIAAKIHNHLCDNVWNEHSLIVNEGLPF